MKKKWRNYGGDIGIYPPPDAFLEKKTKRKINLIL